ncbi:MAG: glycosyltransferase [Acidimicrobiales bacterium]
MEEDLEGLQSMVPQVVAVIVACDPGEWFEEALAAFAAQDYPELSVLVLDSSAGEGLTQRVASVLPSAYVRWLGGNEGFGASANSVLEMVEGASHFLLCHDDVAPDPDAVGILVEESFRSNAGVVAPKLVSWEDPRRLLHVGMAADKGGGVVDRVEPGEIDHGQHDSVRDIFLATGGCTLVRADLFAEIGGFDPQIFAMGEDLDLCWRAQVAGARVVVAPAARVRHLELLAGGRRNLPDAVHLAVPTSSDLAAGAAGAAEKGSPRATCGRRRSLHVRRPQRRRTEQVTLQSLQRRHELRAVLKNYSRFHRARVLPQVVFLQSAEVLIALVSGHRDRAAAVLHAWRWNLTERSSLQAARTDVRASRRLSDSAVRRLQLHGSARLNAYLRRAVTQGMRAARLGALEEAEEASAAPPAAEQADAEHRRIARVTRPARSTVWAVVALVLVFGSRELLGSGFPYVGQLLPFATWSSFLHHFVSGWQPSGVGTVGSASPATGLLGLGGLVLFGGTGLLQKVVVLGCVPLGAYGMSRLVGAYGSVRARLIAAVAYIVVPLPYDALATGRWDALLAYAVCPWIVARLARASGTVPLPPASIPSRPLPAWRTTILGRALGLGVLEAFFCALAPTVAVLTLVIAAGVVRGLVRTGGRGSARPAGRVAAVAIGATVVTGVLLEPWSVSVLVGPARWQTLFGLASTPASGPTWGALLRLGIGPIGDTPIAWGFVAAAVLPLLIATGRRLAWAGSAWTFSLGSLLLAWASGRGWLGVFRVPGEVLLVPAAVGTALAIGLGVAAFEADLVRHRFGWRQASAALAGVLVAVATVPFLAAIVPGRWDTPTNGFGQATSWMARQTRGPFRVLWLGDPTVVPGGSWQLSPGLAYELSEQGLANANSLWPGSSPGAAGRVGRDVQLVVSNETVRLGRLLAPYAVRYVVVVSSLGTQTPGSPVPVERRPPPSLLSGLSTQVDLRQVIDEPGLVVFADDLALPERAIHAAGSRIPSSAGTLTGWRPALDGASGATAVTGRVGRGTLFDAVAPANAFELARPHRRAERAHVSFGYAPSFASSRPGTVTVRFAGSWRHGLAVIAEVLVWVLALCALGIRRTPVAHRLRRVRARRARRWSSDKSAALERPDYSPARPEEVVR